MKKLFILSLALGVSLAGFTFAQEDAAPPQQDEAAAAEIQAAPETAADEAAPAEGEAAADKTAPSEGDFAPHPGPPHRGMHHRHHGHDGHHGHHGHHGRRGPRGEWNKTECPGKEGPCNTGAAEEKAGRGKCGPSRGERHGFHKGERPNGKCRAGECPEKDGPRHFSRNGRPPRFEGDRCPNCGFHLLKGKPDKPAAETEKEGAPAEEAAADAQ